MVQIIKKISLEVSKPNLIQAIVAKQYDNNSRFLQVTLMHEGKKIEIAPTSTVIINAKRIDGEEKPFAGEANNDGTATVPLTYWMLELEGEVWCDVSVVDTDGRKLTSTKFDLLVERASCSSGDITEDENYDILVKLIEDVKALTPASVDQHYDPTSENPQSGVAVAEALATINNKIPSLYVNEWENDKPYYYTELLNPEPKTIMYQFTDGSTKTLGELPPHSFVSKSHYFFLDEDGTSVYLDAVVCFNPRETICWIINQRSHAVEEERHKVSNNMNDDVNGDYIPTINAVRDYVDRVIGGIENGSY